MDPYGKHRPDGKKKLSLRQRNRIAAVNPAKDALVTKYYELRDKGIALTKAGANLESDKIKEIQSMMTEIAAHIYELDTGKKPELGDE